MATSPMVGGADPAILKSLETQTPSVARTAPATVSATTGSATSNGSSVSRGLTPQVSGGTVTYNQATQATAGNSVTVTSSTSNDPADVVTIYTSPKAVSVSSVNQTVNTYKVNNYAGNEYTDSNVANYLPTFTGNVGAGNVNVTGTVYANGLSSTGLASLTTLNVSTTANLGAVGNVRITGGTNGYVLSTNGSGNLSWVAQSGGGGNGSPGGSNTQIQFNDSGNFGANSGFTFDNATGNISIPGTITSGSTITIDNRASGNGADINLYSADDITLQARDRDAGSTSEGGDVNIYAGDSAEDSDTSGGDVNIQGGNGGASNTDFGGSGGFINIQSGQGGAAVGTSISARSGGSLTLSAGDAGTNNGNIDLGNSGGDVTINAGDSTGNGDPGGSIILRSGDAGANALAGSVQVVIPSSDIGTGGNWTFGGDGSTIYPNLTVTRGDRTGTLTGQTLLFGDSTQEAIITTPNGTNDFNDSQRFVINPGAGAANTAGEGGDIYLYAGRGGSASGSGGDIKIRGGLGPVDGHGGYIDINGGEAAGNGPGGYIEIFGGQSANNLGGEVRIEGGQGGTTGGNANLRGGYGQTAGGNVNIWGGGSANGQANEGLVNIQTGGNTWTFAPNGNLTLPGDIVGPASANFTIYSNAAAHEFVFGDDGTFYAPDNVVLGGNSIYIGPGANTLGGIEHEVFIASSNLFPYVQAVVNNVSDNGSADWVALGARGGDEGGTTSLGFTSSGFGDANYTITGHGDGYVLVQSYAPGQTLLGGGGNLVLATGNQGSTKDIIFGTGGFLTANTFGRISHANNSFELSRAGATITFPDATEQNTAWTGSVTTIANGNSNVNIATANGNVTINSVGNTTMTITGTGANVTGTLTSTGKIGYASGSSVTQLTSRGTGVTINAIAGTIITTSAAMVATEIDTFSVTNSAVDPNNDIVLAQIVSPNQGTYDCIANPAVIGGFNNGFFLNIVNISGFTTSDETITIRFMVIKAPNA